MVSTLRYDQILIGLELLSQATKNVPASGGMALLRLSTACAQFWLSLEFLPLALQ